MLLVNALTGEHSGRRRLRRHLLCLWATSVLFLAVPCVAAAQEAVYEFNGEGSHVDFVTRYLGFWSITGRFSGVTGQLRLDPENWDSAHLDVRVATATLKTQDSVWERRLTSEECLDVKRFPELSFHSTSVRRTGAQTADVAGTLTLHGVTREVVLTGQVRPIDQQSPGRFTKIVIDAATHIRRSEFGMTAFRPLVSDHTEVHIELTAVSRPAIP
jgi:polyisoprenoid-binding protein YceI